MVGKTEINGKKYAVTLILSDKGKDLLYISVFGLQNSMVKSMPDGGEMTHSHKGPIAAVVKLISPTSHNLSIPYISAMSIEKLPNIEISMQNITPQNRKMQFANGGLKYAANGEADIFLGEVESREDILSRILNTNVIKKAIDSALIFFGLLKEGKAKFEKKEIILGKSGLKAHRWVGEEISMNKSIESDQLKKRLIFEKVFYEFFKDEEGKISLNNEAVHKLKALEGYPEGVDTENCCFHCISSDKVIISAGGDWQQMVNITLGEKNGKLEIIELYSGEELMSKSDINRRIKEIEESPYGEALAKGGFIEGKHPRGNNGRFSEKGAENGEKWFRHVLTERELKQFIEDARNGKNVGNALLGMVSDSTKKKVKELTGIEVTKIILEGSSIAHIDDPKHKLEDDDIEKCVKVINDPVDVKLSPEQTNQGLNVVCFEGNINGQIYFLEAAHKTYDGWLSLKTAYRKKEVSAVSHWPGSPGTNAQNAPPPTSTILSPKSGEKPTPEQTALLDGLDSLSLPPVQRSS